MACKPAVTVQGSEGRHLIWANGWRSSEFISASQRLPTGPSVKLSSPMASGTHTKGLMLSLNDQSMASAFNPIRRVAVPFFTSNLRLAWAASDTRFLSKR